MRWWKSVTGFALVGPALLLGFLAEDGYAITVGPNKLIEQATQQAEPTDDWLFTAPEVRQLEEALRLLNKGDFEDAAARAKEVLSSNPDSAAAHEILGVALTGQGRVDEALEEFRTAAGLAPGASSPLTKIGAIQMARGEDEVAKQTFLRAVILDPSDRRAHQRLGILYEQEGDAARAIAHYEKGVVNTHPAYVGVKVYLGRLYNRGGHFIGTVELLEPVVSVDSQNVTAHIVLGTAYLGLRRIEDAIKRFRRALELEPDTERAHLALGIAYREARQFDASLRELDAVVRLKPEWSTAHFQRGETLFASKRYDEAVKAYQTAARYSPASLGSEKRVADVYLAQKRVADATGIYTSLIQSGQADIDTYIRLGEINEAQGRFEKAEQTFTAMVERFPNEPLAHYRLGTHYGLLRKYDAAIRQYQEGLRIRPADRSLLKGLSVAYRRKGDRRGAIDAAERLRAVTPESIPNAFYLATLYQGADRRVDAIQLYREILASEPNHVFSLNNLADQLGEQGQDEEALRLAEKAASLAEDNGLVQDTLGWIQFRRGQTEEALATLERAVALSPDVAVIRYHLGAVYYKLGRREQARITLTRATQLGADAPWRADAEALLKTL